jgi:ABC-type branched-subunit amino acid transport system ATPase component
MPGRSIRARGAPELRIDQPAHALQGSQPPHGLDLLEALVECSRRAPACGCNATRPLARHGLVRRAPRTSDLPRRLRGRGRDEILRGIAPHLGRAGFGLRDRLLEGGRIGAGRERRLIGRRPIERFYPFDPSGVFPGNLDQQLPDRRLETVDCFPPARMAGPDRRIVLHRRQPHWRSQGIATSGMKVPAFATMGNAGAPIGCGKVVFPNGRRNDDSRARRNAKDGMRIPALPEPARMPVVLETIGLQKRFGGVAAVRDVSLRVERGARHALIGPNGAGKTTVIDLLSGAKRPTSGRILLEGNDITALEPHRRTRLGIARTFQINQLFPDLTPVESLGLVISERLGTGTDWWRTAGTKPQVVDEIADLIERFRLADAMHERTATLPYGKQRLLEIALAVACRPRLLLLDEPAAGVPEADRHELLATIASSARDVTILLIEHDMDLVFGFAERISVLVNGAVFVEGTPDEVARDPRVKAVYLGEEVHAPER